MNNKSKSSRKFKRKSRELHAQVQTTFKKTHAAYFKLLRMHITLFLIATFYLKA